LRYYYSQKCDDTDFRMETGDYHITPRQHCLTVTEELDLTYTDIHDEKEMRCSPWKKDSIGSEIGNLLIELCYDPQGILKESCDD
jgi:hypothetical protein